MKDLEATGNMTIEEIDVSKINKASQILGCDDSDSMHVILRRCVDFVIEYSDGEEIQDLQTKIDNLRGSLHTSLHTSRQINGSFATVVQELTRSITNLMNQKTP